jgi:hypothetical protein
VARIVGATVGFFIVKYKLVMRLSSVLVLKFSLVLEGFSVDVNVPSKGYNCVQVLKKHQYDIFFPSSYIPVPLNGAYF